MKNYIIRRILMVFPLLLAITFIAFVLTTFIPSDPAEVALRVNEIIPTEEAIAQVREELGLNRPFFIRYLYWLKDCFSLDFGTSYVNNNRTVAGEIGRCLPATLKLGALSFILVIGISIPLGMLSALFHNTLFDRLTRLTVFITTAIPNYWLGLLLMWVFALKLRWLPSHGAVSFKHYLLPALTLSMTFIATYVRLIRNSMLDKMHEDFIFYARARGISESSVIGRHLLKNSLQSSLNALGMSLVKLIAGTFVIENIFGIPGIGRLCISAIFNRDYPVIQAYILMMGVLFVFCNLLIDVIQVFIDPRLAKGSCVS
jgi:nickel transport system permease protein